MSQPREPVLSGEMTPNEAAMKLLLVRLKFVWKCLVHIAKSGQESVEGVHRLRVASRRATAALELFAPLFPSKTINKVQGMVRKMRRSADALRDMDVLLEKIKRLKPDAYRYMWSDLIKKDRDSAGASLGDLFKLLGRTNRFPKSIKKLFKQIRLEKEMSYAQWARARVQRVVCVLVDVFPEQKTGDKALHLFRIAVKKARYALELTVEAGTGNPNLLRLLEKIQTRFGTMNDRFVAIDDLKRRCVSNAPGPWHQLLVREKLLAGRARKTLNSWMILMRPLLESLVCRI